MNAAVAQARRLAASPYARRLARERALPLEALRGSGPGGRILAADVTAFVPVAAPINSPEVIPAAASRIAAFASSVAVGALQDLLAVLKSSGKIFDIDDLLLRAIGRAFTEEPDAAKGGQTSVALEFADRQAVWTMVPEIALTQLREMRLAALADGRDEREKPAALSLRLFPASDIRPVVLPLLPGRAMRLAVSPNLAGSHAESLLAVDVASVDEARAAAWLSALKSAIEHPLRLLV